MVITTQPAFCSKGPMAVVDVPRPRISDHLGTGLATETPSAAWHRPPPMLK